MTDHHEKWNNKDIAFVLVFVASGAIPSGALIAWAVSSAIDVGFLRAWLWIALGLFTFGCALIYGINRSKR